MFVLAQFCFTVYLFLGTKEMAGKLNLSEGVRWCNGLSSLYASTIKFFGYFETYEYIFNR